MRILLTFLAATLAMSVASAKEGTFFGRYKMDVQDYGGVTEFEFLVNSKDKMTVINTRDYSGHKLYQYDAQMFRLAGVNTYGPSVEQVQFAVAYGSDENGVTAYVTLAWLGENGSRELTAVSAYVTEQDGPNEISHALEGVALYKWNKRTKKYDAIPGLD